MTWWMFAYAVNDLRNQAAKLGAMVMGEARVIGYASTARRASAVRVAWPRSIRQRSVAAPANSKI
jgi:hypothetical protein